MPRRSAAVSTSHLPVIGAAALRPMLDDLVTHGLARNVVLLAGAGVSAGPPTSLPSWKPLNAAIVRALVRRFQRTLFVPDMFDGVAGIIDEVRERDAFPPEYQAQLLEEMAGERYFRALQSLDIDLLNASHDAIARLAAAGALRAIVTTNFDRLIEKALTARRVRYVVAYDESGFVRARRALSAPRRRKSPLLILKIHGCVSDHRSLVDTLKQRKLGRSAKLLKCLSTLHDAYWLFAGFSAADLEGDPDYLGLRQAASRSPGATYVAWPGHPPQQNASLSRGAQVLMAAFGDRGIIAVAEVPDLVAQLRRRLPLPAARAIRPRKRRGVELVDQSLDQWADRLTPAAAGLCLGALLEAVGHAEVGVRVLDRLVRKELYGKDRTGDDFVALQLHYGRMGAALGRFIHVPDLNGAASNASIESVQSLLRIRRSRYAFSAAGHRACTWLWIGRGADAAADASAVIDGANRILAANEHAKSQGGRRPPRKYLELAVDGWIAAAQVAAVLQDVPLIELVVIGAEAAVNAARQCGDVVRAARVRACWMLVLATTRTDVDAMNAEGAADFAEAARVGDGWALGVRALAVGRWLVGVGGIALRQAANDRGGDIPKRALAEFDVAEGHFARQGFDAWLAFLLVQRTKARLDLNDFDAAQESLNGANALLVRFPIWRAAVYEAAGQGQMLGRAASAAASFEHAAAAAEESGLSSGYINHLKQFAAEAARSGAQE